MDNTLNLSGDKDAVLKQIDALHEQHRLRKLRELICTNHVWNMDKVLTKESAENMDVDALIFALLQSSIDIPPELTFGEPYDSAFHTFMTRQLQSRYHVPDFLYLLLKYAKELPMFLVYSIQINQESIYRDHIGEIEEKIWDKIHTLSQGTRLTFTWELQFALKNTTLSRLDIIYIAVMLDQIGAFHSLCDLRIFVMASKLHS